MEWLNVEDKLPKHNEHVLCFKKSYGMFVALYSRNEAKYEPKYFDTWDSGHCCGREPPDPTHWMPLPEPPKE